MLFTLWMAECCAAAQAPDFITERAVMVDSGGQLALEQVKHQAFQVYQSVLTGGYSRSTYWVRLRIAAAPDTPLVLRIRPSYLDELTLYELSEDSADAPGLAHPRTSGSLASWSQADYKSVNLGFMLKASGRSRTLYLRVRSTSTMLLHVEALTTAQAARADQVQEFIYSLYLGLLLLFLVWALIQWLVSREHLVGWFAMTQSVVIMHTLGVLGYARLLLADTWPPSLLDHATALMRIVYVCAFGLFHLALQNEFKPRRWPRRCALASVLGLTAALALFMTGDLQRALQINAAIATVGSVVFMWSACSTQVWRESASDRAPPIPRVAFLLFYLVAMALTFAFTLPSLGLLPATEFLLNAPVSTGTINGIFMLTLMLIRARNLDRANQGSLLMLQVAEQRARAERQRREEQSHFLSMLTHELKTPLSVVRMVLSAPGSGVRSDLMRAEAVQAVHEMTGVIERCVQAGKLSDQSLATERQEVRLREDARAWVEGQAWAERLSWEVAEPLPAIHTDPQLLRICLINLLENAAKYSPPASPLGISLLSEAWEGRAGVQIKVSNLPGSAGWPDGGKVFQRYYRSPGAHQMTGSGLGLYLVQGLMTLIGGHASYAPTSSHITFLLWIPV